MYKMIIADDNPWEREGIKNILDWNQLGIEITGLYPNGKKVLDSYEDNPPDIILTDISMPIVSGLELAKTVKEKHPEIIILFMTAYSEFEYAKTAIDLNIYSYILKPINKDELEQAVIKALTRRENENSVNRERENLKKQLKEYLPFIREQFLKEYLFGAYSNINDITGKLAYLNIETGVSPMVQVVCVNFSTLQEDGNLPDIDNNYFIQYSLKKIITAHSSDHAVLHPIQTAPDEISILVFLKANAETDATSGFLDIIISVKQQAERDLKICAIIGISYKSGDIMDVPQLYKQSSHSAKSKLFGSLSQIINYSEIELLQNNDFGRSLELQTLYKEVTELISLGEEKEITEFIEKYLPLRETVLKENYVRSFSFAVINMLNILLLEFNESFKGIFDDEMLVWNKLVRFNTIVDVRQWIYNLIRTIKHHLNNNDKNAQRKPVQKIINYIKKSYNEQITIGDIAETVHFSATHANNIFKKEMGVTIFDYLIEYRMEKAKELLKDPESRIYIVSEQVGYTNKSYFCELFKRHTGLTPNEYKNRVVL